MCSIPFPKVTRQKSQSSLRTKEYGIESRIQPHGNMGAGEWRMPSSAFISPSQFYCVCLASGSRCEILFWGGFCGILSPHHRYIHLSSEAIGIDLSWPFLDVFSASYLVWGKKLAILYTAASWGTFLLSSFKNLGQVKKSFAIGIPNMTSIGLVILA